ncbi:DUF4062 domain-containing protein [Pseudomonas sp. URMO17WK12:I2]|uniref:DUF4062 domain-containing protein n=1 Tax=Pseudomonas sp. URMO17WK12:I2 TaxID=1261623 RepID=UPI000DAD1DF8|nr:DUF4062 domain-containing protein [Pseudomonas sp. URMO17WK12:I2]PZW41949.1 uncharacterized protein DUF4062 [Pseudomonas sp. URMO17WK12:I2]
MSAKYQIFVSSTFVDLKDERDLVIKAILEMGHIPVGMEMFSAADEEQWNIIKRQIDQSDYYVVIAAHRYGSCDASGISYTEKEYDYACEIGVPSLGFILDDSVSWPREKSDTETVSVQRLELFKTKVKSKPVSFWRGVDDLYGKCSIALMKAFNAYPREGWVRASQVQDSAASKEVVRLSGENAGLRARIAEYEKANSEEHAIAQTLEMLRGNTRDISVWKKGDTNWSVGKEVTLYQIFEVLAPELQVECDLVTICRFVGTNIANVPMGELRNTWPTPRNIIRTILADFAALNCIVPSKRKKPVSDTNEYWTLGEFGVNMLAHMRRRRLANIESLSALETDADK